MLHLPRANELIHGLDLTWNLPWIDLNSAGMWCWRTQNRGHQMGSSGRFQGHLRGEEIDEDLWEPFPYYWPYFAKNLDVWVFHLIDWGSIIWTFHGSQ